MPACLPSTGDHLRQKGEYTLDPYRTSDDYSGILTEIKQTKRPLYQLLRAKPSYSNLLFLPYICAAWDDFFTKKTWEGISMLCSE